MSTLLSHNSHCVSYRWSSAERKRDPRSGGPQFGDLHAEVAGNVQRLARLTLSNVPFAPSAVRIVRYVLFTATLVFTVFIGSDLWWDKTLAVAADEIRIVLQRPTGSDGHSTFAVVGLTPAQLSALRLNDPSDPSWSKVFQVFVAQDGDTDRPALFGEYRVTEHSVVFRPRFPLSPGVIYCAVFRPSGLPSAVATGSERTVEQSFAIPPSAPTKPTVIWHVFPSRAVLPENQLKFYIYFSAPMSRGEAYQRIRLIESSGKEVEFPFLELHEELWDDSGTRFTLFFDPGRIKRGLKPREEVGPSLKEGKSYTLVIDRLWLDAAGQPLKEPFVKSFSVVAPDDKQPATQNWRLHAPAAASRDPLTVQFDESLDHAMLNRVLVVTDSERNRVEGEITIDQAETRWRFRPDQPWRPGQYQLVVHTTLEDLAGNSLGRPFEVDVFQSVQQSITTDTVELPFQVQSPP